MQLQQRINAFAQLGTYLGSEEFRQHEILRKASEHNSWFTSFNLEYCITNWSKALNDVDIQQWLEVYSIEEPTPKTVAVIMAGNIPLVGFHDFITVLLSGHKVLAKLSSSDTLLLPFLAKKLVEIEPAFEGFIEFSDEKLENFDAVVATGSNNTARYFDYYFGKYPNIIRRNRNSVAVLTGNETNTQLEGLADDIFRYFGMGCRNVSKLFVPKDYNFDAFFKAMFSWKEVINEHRYINNYDYNKAVYLMSNIPLLDNEFMLLKEDTGYASPISVVYYEYYDDLELLKAKLTTELDQIQAVVSTSDLEDAIPFGKAQSPNLGDYADGVDTLDFLLNL